MGSETLSNTSTHQIKGSYGILQYLCSTHQTRVDIGGRTLGPSLDHVIDYSGVDILQ